jgi:ankyrin repeat protein
MMDLLLELAADINAGTNLGQTALHFSASMDTRILKHLLGNGANLEVSTLQGRTLKGETPLEWATET